MEIIQTLFFTIWEGLKLFGKNFWEMVTLVPKAIGLHDWTIIAVVIAIIILILLLRRFFR